MRYFFILLCTTLICCQSRKTRTGFDLIDVQFPIEKTYLEKQFVLLTADTYSAYYCYPVTDKKALCFDGYNFVETTEDSSLFMHNRVYFYQDRATKKLDAYNISSRSEATTTTIRKILTDNFGKPDFYYKISDVGFSYRIWEEDNKWYFFETVSGLLSDEREITGELYVVNPQNITLNYNAIHGPFIHWTDYLSTREEKPNAGRGYSYRDFVEEQEERAKKKGRESEYTQGYVR